MNMISLLQVMGNNISIRKLFTGNIIKMHLKQINLGEFCVVFSIKIILRIQTSSIIVLLLRALKWFF